MAGESKIKIKGTNNLLHLCRVIALAFMLLSIMPIDTSARRRAYPIYYAGSIDSAVMQYYAERNGNKRDFVGFEQDVNMSLGSYIYSPDMITYDTSFGLRWYNRRAGSSSVDQDTLNYHYGLALGFFRNGQIPVKLWAKKLISRLDTEKIPTSNSTTDAYGASFSLLFKTLPRTDVLAKYTVYDLERPFLSNQKSEHLYTSVVVQKTYDISNNYLKVENEFTNDKLLDRKNVTQRAYIREIFYPTERMTIDITSNFSKVRDTDNRSKITDKTDTVGFDARMGYQRTDRLQLIESYSFFNSRHGITETLGHRIASRADYRYTQRFFFEGGITGSYNENRLSGDIQSSNSAEGIDFSALYSQPLGNYLFTYNYTGGFGAIQQQGANDENGYQYSSSLRFGMNTPAILYFRHTLNLTGGFTRDTSDLTPDTETFNARLRSIDYGFRVYRFDNSMQFNKRLTHFNTEDRDINTFNERLSIFIRKWDRVSLNGNLAYSLVFGDTNTASNYFAGMRANARLSRNLSWQSGVSYTVHRSEGAGGDYETLTADSDLYYNYRMTRLSLEYDLEFRTSDESEFQEHIALFRVSRSFGRILGL